MNQKSIDALPELIDAEQTAEVVGLTAEEVRDLCEAGSLPAVKLGGEWRIRKGLTLRLIRNDPRFRFARQIDLGPIEGRDDADNRRNGV